MDILPKPLEFEWDMANVDKNWLKHKIEFRESEEPFFDLYRKLWKDILHSKSESRFILLGQTRMERILFIAFTIREQKVRIISARPAHKKERIMYAIAKAQKINSA